MNTIKRFFFNLLGIKKEEEIRKIVRDEIIQVLAKSRF